MINKKHNSTKYLLYLNVLLLLLLFCCASTKVVQELPGWVKKPTSKYREALYLSAVGSGGSREEAKRDAISSLSNIFRVDVYSDRRIIKVYTKKKLKSLKSVMRQLRALKASKRYLPRWGSINCSNSISKPNAFIH